eukprot:GHRR01034793.1.p1 GENE.GHRR01034793.1~~GHRR01034793.1.p1  ORF type:complete len:107 (-),score=37.11 GHRR01034793.1:85-405(-)
MLSSAWLLYTRSTGCTPLGQGQWPRFLVFYAGAYAVQHVARPLKLACGLAGAPVGNWLLRVTSAVLGGRSSHIALVWLLGIQAVLLLCCLGAVAVYATQLVAAVAV